MNALQIGSEERPDSLEYLAVFGCRNRTFVALQNRIEVDLFLLDLLSK